MFRSLILSACLIGVALGLIVTAVQAVGVTPILLDAEQYEVVEASAPDAGTHGEQPDHHQADYQHHSHQHDDHQRHESATGHHHGGDDWAPADGAERTFYTALSNIFAGIGFAAVMLVVMAQLRERGKLALTPTRGLLLGGLGYLAVFVAPSIGLPPEIPGTAAAPLEARQLWWAFTVSMVLAGFALLFLARGWIKLVGVPCLVLPYLVVPAHPDGPLFSHPDPEAVAALNELHHEFIWASGMTNLVFWLMAGLFCVLALKRLYDASPEQRDEVAA
ncbi:CbtA family protein [Marinobacter fonticola]|uniref:CbtA family protein n=1 Tax=Marinobacter fonticola TaxID=2603215 RepID=UPI0011E65481|nr:CbtA family protein [Marinobacter fonticola]